MKDTLELNSELGSVSSGPPVLRSGAAELGSGHKWAVAAQLWKVTMRPYDVQGGEQFSIRDSEAQLGLSLEGTIGERKFFNSKFQVFL